MAFSIRPPFWKSWWAWILYSLTVTGLGFLIHHRRLIRVARRAADLEEIVVLRTREPAGINLQLQEASLTDALTGLGNRRYLSLNLQREVDLTLRQHVQDPAVSESDLLFLILDIDHFKKINDTYGHRTGDEVLMEVADRIRSVARSGDLVARWGGEEFLLVSRSFNRQTGETVAGRLLQAIGNRPVAVKESVCE